MQRPVGYGADRCDCCNASLSNARVIAGASDAPKHFCSYGCYAFWKASNEHWSPSNHHAPIAAKRARAGH